MNYTKPPISIPDQLTKLQGRGLQIPNPVQATECLSNISYYRLRGYTHPYQLNAQPGKPFRHSISFNTIVSLYTFDRELRLLVLNAIERIEVSLRARIINEFSITHGSHWFEDSTLFKRQHLLTKDLTTLDKEIDRSSETFIFHYKRTYTNPARPPAWMSLEVTSLGLLSRLYENLKLTPAKKKVAADFGLSPTVLESWMHAISTVRNICAHHGRLWNRIFSQGAVFPNNASRTFLTYAPAINKPYMVFSCIIYLLAVADPTSSFKNLIKQHLANLPGQSLAAMGFPNNWQHEVLWQ